MIENLDILYSVASQSLEFRAPEGVPSSITSTVYENADSDDVAAELATTGSAAASSVNTTVDAAAGDSEANPLLIPLAATTNIAIGKRYLLTNAAGEDEFIEVREIDAGVSVTARHNLKNDYASGATFQGTHITHALDDAWVADINNISAPSQGVRYRWRLEYTAGGKTCVQHAYFDLVRYSGGTTVEAGDVDAAYPWLGWISKLPHEDRDDRGQRIIKEAYRQVKLEMIGHDKADEAHRDRQLFEGLIIHRAALLLASDPEDIDRIEKQEQKAWKISIIGAALEMDADGSGASQEADKAPFFVR